MTYIGFTNNDVKYQKNKLKKSFLRLMFFDSMSPTNQNLLAYYTVFMDSGGYFSKFVKHVELTDYYKAPADGGRAITDLVGLRVDREPTIDERGELIQESTVDEVRLGTRFIISDKYSSDASSEGFYLYLWKDNFEGTVPQDIYMKVEFNHAGFGRTVPLIMWPKNIIGQPETLTVENYLKNLYIRVRIALSDRGYVYSFPDAVSSENEEAGGRRNGIVWENERLVLNLFEPRITPDEFEE